MALTLFKNTNDNSNITVLDKDGIVRVLKPYEECELFDKNKALERGLENSRAKAIENAAKKAAKKEEQ